MNRVTIINGLKGEGKTEEVIQDFLGHVKNDSIMKHFILTTAPYEETVSLVEFMLKGLRKDNPDFAKDANMGVYHIDTWVDLKRIASDVDDDSTVLYIDGTEDLDRFNLEEFMELVDEHQFDCYITRQRCKELRSKNIPDTLISHYVIPIFKGYDTIAEINTSVIRKSRYPRINIDKLGITFSRIVSDYEPREPNDFITFRMGNSNAIKLGTKVKLKEENLIDSDDYDLLKDYFGKTLYVFQILNTVGIPTHYGLANKPDPEDSDIISYNSSKIFGFLITEIEQI